MVSTVARPLTAEELSAELAESRRRRAAQDDRVRAEVHDTGRRLSGAEALDLGVTPPPLADGTPFVLSKMKPPPKRKKKK
jgi:hypothetical protein